MITKAQMEAKSKAAGYSDLSPIVMQTRGQRLESGGYWGRQKDNFGWFFVYSDIGRDGRDYLVSFMRRSGAVNLGLDAEPRFFSLEEAIGAAKWCAANDGKWWSQFR